MPSPSCWSASDTPTRSIDAANGPSVSENPPRMSEGHLRLRHQLQLEELDGEHAEQRGRHRQVDPQPGAALEVDARGRAAHERDLERHLDVAAGQLAQERIALAEGDHELAVADRQAEGGFLARDLDAVGEGADLESGAVGRADDERRRVHRRRGDRIALGVGGPALVGLGTHADPRRERGERAHAVRSRTARTGRTGRRR